MRLTPPTPRPVYMHAKDFGALGDGVTDDTAALQAAVTAAVAIGGVVLLDLGTYLLTATLLVQGRCSVVGQGWDSILKVADGTNIFAFTLQPASGAYVSNVRMTDFAIDGNNTNQTTGGGGIHAQGSVQCWFERLHIGSPCEVGLWLDNFTGGTTGHHNRVSACLFDNGAAASGSNNGQGLRLKSNDENTIEGCDFENNGNEAAGEPYHVKEWAGSNNFVGCTFVAGGEGIRVQDNGLDRITGCHFDHTSRDALQLSGDSCAIVGCTFYGTGSHAANTYSDIWISGTAYHAISGNCFRTDIANASTRSCVRETGSGSSVVVANTFKGTADLGTAITELGGGSGTVVTNNVS